MAELLAYAGAVLVAYLLWHGWGWWNGCGAYRLPSLPELKVDRELTPIDLLSVRGGRSTSWLSPPRL